MFSQKPFFIAVLTVLLTICQSVGGTEGEVKEYPFEFENLDLEDLEVAETWQQLNLKLKNMPPEEWDYVTYGVKDPEYFFIVTLGSLRNYPDSTRVVIEYGIFDEVLREVTIRSILHIDLVKKGLNNEGEPKFEAGILANNHHPEIFKEFLEDKWSDGCPREIIEPLSRAIRVVRQYEEREGLTK